MKLDNIKVKCFKSLKDIDLDLSNLTVITGVNSSGKSSLIQVLLLMRNNIHIYQDLLLQRFLMATQPLNPQPLGPQRLAVTKLGDKKSLLHQNSLGEDIIFQFGYDDTFAGIKLDSNLLVEEIYDGDRSDGDRSDGDRSDGDRSDGDRSDGDRNRNEKRAFGLMNFGFINFFSSLRYLNTNRAEPDLIFPFSETNIEHNSIGEKGEFTAHYLAENSNQCLGISELKHTNSTTENLLDNVEKWLNEISDNVKISATSDATTQSAKLTYQYYYNDDKNLITTSEQNPLNVGFGLTYVLPVIVAILASRPGDCLIIENPESHLHPKGQSRIAQLFAIAAHNGVQVIVETHSDHFLNGLRVATKNKIITPEESQIYFFSKEKNGIDTIAHSINIDENGKLTDWPKNFFDEWDNQLDKLLW